MKITKQIQNNIHKHVEMLREGSIMGESDFISIYDNQIYTNIFIDDVELFASKVNPQSKVLDFGCGRGTSSFVLSQLDYDVTGLEVSYDELGDHLTSYVFSEKRQIPLWEKTKELAKSLNDKSKLNFNFYDGKSLPFKDNEFDAIFAYAVLEHVDDLSFTLKELHRVLKPKGLLFVSRTPNKYSYSEKLAKILKVPAHDNLYSKSEITNYLRKNKFQIKSIELIDFFPARLPVINKYYQQFASIFMVFEKLVRYLPLKYISHHWRIIAYK